jgi:hypothetical protein
MQLLFQRMAVKLIEVMLAQLLEEKARSTEHTGHRQHEHHANVFAHRNVAELEARYQKNYEEISGEGPRGFPAAPVAPGPCLDL